MLIHFSYGTRISVLGNLSQTNDEHLSADLSRDTTRNGLSQFTLPSFNQRQSSMTKDSFQPGSPNGHNLGISISHDHRNM